MKRSLTILVIILTVTLAWAQNPITKLTFEEAVTIGLERNMVLNQQKNQLEANQAQKLNAIGNHVSLKPNRHGFFKCQFGYRVLRPCQCHY